jgi:nucleoside-diphosphate-sugar epimerase
MKILLTGSEGYIGTNFNNLYQDLDITNCDIKLNYDILDIQRLNVDCIIHLAAISGIKNCEDDYDLTIRNNILTTLHLLRFGIPIVFASSQAAKNPTNTYSLTKRISETIIMCSNIPYTILRFANVYGGKKYYDYKTSVMSKFFNSLKNKEPITVHGDGKQTRDLIHVNDVCDAIYLATKNPVYNPVDIGTGKETKIRDLAYMISDDVEFIKNIDSGVGGNVANTEDAKNLLGFESKIKLEEYIKEFKKCLI